MLTFQRNQIYIVKTTEFTNMNPLTNMKNVIKLSEQELNTSFKTSWHDQYKDSAWIFVGGLPFDLTEGDIITVFSQYGEIVNINLVRDKDSGKSRGFCFLCYEDQRSTALAVDNFNGIRLLGRILRVDHVSDYKMPKDGKKTDEETKRLYQEGCAPKAEPVQTQEVKPFVMEPQDLRETLADQISGEIKLPMRLPIYTIKDETSSIATEMEQPIKIKKEKKSKKEKKHKKKKSKSHKKSKSKSSDDSDSTSDDNSNEDKHRKEKSHKRKSEDKHTNDKEYKKRK